ncbi:Flavin-dependent oxidoreductase, luciferase family (includes alkanesulfonate monooxygenase SsuD and methylene tetrahydromethanopterin reductase) [Devosia sp. YR412]|uniref:LLM class flavin-dependent oxidoreductase n=1 Tax=Devosia sp. YR412 TaxID=1881030 RepID=UPI0008D6B69E|nr:LLM class flavin-dependent oxidoreductase [Devosia sp. YR412]SEP67287.1 Flavin-dependent oxidoreductase, luciferase family (includes alkanesulfonate monooxygenase SsuD and methylene tetrahydromethanopterin reductase) [Devosia sp. YR412]
MSPTIRHIGFLTPGNFSNDAPFEGIDATLNLIAFGERLGFDSAWVRQRHLEPGIGSAAVFLAAASQRTSTIQLGSAVIQIGYESPFRLAEDLSMVDVLSRGRLNVGLSAGVPPHAALIGDLVHDGDWQSHDLGHNRIARFAANLRGDYLGDDDTTIATPFGPQRPRLQPHAAGLADRLWYGGGSLKSARWAGENGFNLLTGNVVSGENTDDFHTAQGNLIAAYRQASGGRGRVALGRVIVPTDTAPRARIARYEAFATGRYERTLAPNGPKRTLFPRDLVGTAEQIIDWLRNDPVLPLIDELRLELPYEFTLPEYEQILTDTITHIAPALGWTPTATTNAGRLRATA